jgi:hypothetical protein
MDENNKLNSFIIPIVIILIIGGLVGWSISNVYNRNQSTSNDYKLAVNSIVRDLDTTNAQLEALIDEQVRACKTKGINVFITKPFTVQESIGIETTISIKIKYLNWQIELTLALSKMLNSTTINPKQRTGTIGNVGSTEYGDSVPALPRGVTISR